VGKVAQKANQGGLERLKEREGEDGTHWVNGEGREKNEKNLQGE